MNKVIEYFNKPLLKIPLQFGAATGIVAFLFFLGLYSLDVMPLGNKRSMDLGIFIIMMAAACWYYRKKIGGGYMHFWEALTVCYVVNTVAAFITGWLIYLFITFVDPSVFLVYLEEMKQLLAQGKGELVKNIGEADYQVMLNSIGETKPETLITDELSKKTVMAVLPILIISLILRRQRPGDNQLRS